MNQKNFINILLIIIVFAVFIVGIYFAPSRKPAAPISAPTSKHISGTFSSCQDLYNEIENDIKNANYCKTDSDCDVLDLGGSYTAFGCYHFINKGADKNQFYQKLKIYDKKKCIRAIDDCALAPKPTCVLNKCAYIKK